MEGKTNAVIVLDDLQYNTKGDSTLSECNRAS